MVLCAYLWCFTRGCPACFVLDANIERQSCGGWVDTGMEVVGGFSTPAVAAPKPNLDRIVNFWSKHQSEHIHIETPGLIRSTAYTQGYLLLARNSLHLSR